MSDGERGRSPRHHRNPDLLPPPSLKPSAVGGLLRKEEGRSGGGCSSSLPTGFLSPPSSADEWGRHGRTIVFITIGDPATFSEAATTIPFELTSAAAHGRSCCAEPWSPLRLCSHRRFCHMEGGHSDDGYRFAWCHRHCGSPHYYLVNVAAAAGNGRRNCYSPVPFGISSRCRLRLPLLLRNRRDRDCCTLVVVGNAVAAAGAKINRSL
ncbi:hypothetical protein PIB30_099673 [Stylosanthes scabra]|uniref:Uncharacterized protein n=1 Tax=Stylosanthes scabra TaxID=79078 RepID=A0ABU6YXL5_9FABA|nr:hypothetical protein [Stylosanthes scabra]